MWYALHSPYRGISFRHCLYETTDLFTTHAFFHNLDGNKSHLFHTLQAINFITLEIGHSLHGVPDPRVPQLECGLDLGNTHSRSFGLTLWNSAGSFGLKCMRHPSALSVKAMRTDLGTNYCYHYSYFITYSLCLSLVKSLGNTSVYGANLAINKPLSTTFSPMNS